MEHPAQVERSQEKNDEPALSTSEELSKLFSKGEGLNLIISNYADSNLDCPKLLKSAEFEELTEVEEERVKGVVFDKELKFSVPVNIRSSKRAFKMVQSDDPETDIVDDSVFLSWGMKQLDINRSAAAQEEEEVRSTEGLPAKEKNPL